VTGVVYAAPQVVGYEVVILYTRWVIECDYKHNREAVTYTLLQNPGGVP
jgi:hypothetical protein